MKPTFNLTRWRTTTALCIVSTLAIVSAGYGAEWGRSSWDKRGHQKQVDHDSDRDNDKHDNDHDSDERKTASPIKHVIVLIGENRGLDHTFGVYRPKGEGQTISNLLSRGIVKEDGSPGPNFALAQQFSAAAQPAYYVGAPNVAKFAYSTTNAMPQPNTVGAPSAQSDTSPPFKTVA